MTTAEEDARNIAKRGGNVWETQLPFIRQRYDAGNPLAVMDGIIACERANVPLPPWLSKALKIYVIQSLAPSKTGERGRSNNPFGRLREKLKLVARKDAVFAVRQWQKNIHSFGLMPKRAIELWFSGDLKHYRNTVEDAIEIARLGLEGTFAEGSYSTIRKAHLAEWPDVHAFAAFHESLQAFGLRDQTFEKMAVPEHILKCLRTTPLDGEA